MINASFHCLGMSEYGKNFQYVEHKSVKNLASDSLCLSWDDVVAINTEQKRGQEILPQ